MNKTKKQNDLIEIIMLVLLTFLVTFLFHSAFGRTNRTVVKVSAFTSMSDYRKDIYSKNRSLDGIKEPLTLQQG